MTTLKLKKPAAEADPKRRTAAPKAPTRGPLRPSGIKRQHPTLAQAQAERAQRAPAKPTAKSVIGEPRRDTRRADEPRRDPRSSPPQGPWSAPRNPTSAGPQNRTRPPGPDHPPMRRPMEPRPPTHAGLEPERGDEHPRLSRRMSELGLASRREADEWIARGLVRVDGVVVDQLGSRVAPEQRISVDPEAHNEQSRRVTILLHKPLGIVSGQAEDGHAPAATLIEAATRWSGDHHALKFHPSQLHHLVPAGRLDLDSTGLLVLTQDGRVAKTLIGEDSKVEKEYVVHVAWDEQPDAPNLGLVFPQEKMVLLRHGLVIDKQALKPAKVSWQNEHHLRVVLREGKRRQIRRMCEAVGLRVISLKRIRIGRVGLGEMPPGQWRYLGPLESFL